MSFARPAMKCRIAKLLGRRATPIKYTATTENTVTVQPSERNIYVVTMMNLLASGPLFLHIVVYNSFVCSKHLLNPNRISNKVVFNEFKRVDFIAG